MTSMNLKTQNFLPLMGVALVGGLTNQSNAAIVLGQTIGIDFGATAPISSANFNQFSVGGDASTLGLADDASATLASLVDTSGSNVSGVGFMVENKSGQIAWDFSGGVEGSGLMNDDSIFGDGLISNNKEMSPVRPLDDGGHFIFTFTGLDDDLTYDLTGGWDSNNGNFNANWAADGQNFNTAGGGANVGFGSLNGLSTDGSGNLEITITRTTHVTVAGLSLTAVPEPTSALAGILLGAGLLRRRR